MQFLPNDFDEVSDIFSARGACQKFRALLTRKHLDRCDDFAAKATQRGIARTVRAPFDRGRGLRDRKRPRQHQGNVQRLLINPMQGK